MSEALPLLFQTIDDLIEKRSLCALYVWSEEPTKYSHAWLHSRSDYYLIASIFDVDGSYEGIRCIALESVHQLGMDNARMRFVEANMDRESASIHATKFADATDFESFLSTVQGLGESVEIMDDEMESTMGRVAAVDEWSVLMEHFDEDTRTYDGKIWMDFDQVRYVWAFTKRTASASSLSIKLP